MNGLLAVSYWIHLITTVIWLGGIALMVLIAYPAWRKQSLGDNQWLDLQVRLTPFINGSMAFIWISGFIQMTNDEHYAGILTIDSTWAWAMLVKHVVIFVLMAVTFYMQFGLHPAMKRQMLGKESAAPLIKRDATFLRINLLLSLIILLTTAIATAV